MVGLTFSDSDWVTAGGVRSRLCFRYTVFLRSHGQGEVKGCTLAGVAFQGSIRVNPNLPAVRFYHQFAESQPQSAAAPLLSSGDELLEQSIL